MPLASEVFADVPTLIESLEADLAKLYAAQSELDASKSRLAEQIADTEKRLTIARIGDVSDGDGENLFAGDDNAAG
jgi:hypothetical protein